jgi:hypothetical protein
MIETPHYPISLWMDNFECLFEWVRESESGRAVKINFRKITAN